MASRFEEVKRQLAVVRGAWKRSAALKGLAAVLMEAVGIVLVLVLLDGLYQPTQEWRVVALVVAAGALAVLFFRHAIRPLMRDIPDEQIAMYIEEHSKESDGALLSATIFGKEDPGRHNAIYNYIVDRMVAEAAEKAGKIRLSEVLDLSRLRKYALAAVAMIAVFGLSVLTNPDYFKQRAGRIFTPWQMTDEDKMAAGNYVETTPPIEIALTVDPAKDRLLRGSALKLKAKLTRASDEPVVLRFRTAGAPDFHTLPMDEIDELYGYELSLSDLNESVELFVQTGHYASQTMKVEVYDPLKLQGYELTQTPPAYTRQDPTSEFGPTADVRALKGTTVQLRAVADGKLLGGELAFDDGTVVKLTAAQGDGEEGSLIGTFKVEKDVSYTVRLDGEDEQVIKSDLAFYVKALEDEAPTITLKAPASDVAVHPLAELDFRVAANDDVGLSALTLHYALAEGEQAAQTVSFALPEKPESGEHEYNALLPLADVGLNLAPGTTLFYHVSTKDLKGHEVISDIYMLKINPFEVAGAFPAGDPHAPHPHEEIELQLIPYIAAAWNIHTQLEATGKEEHDKRSAKLAAGMVDEFGELRKFHPFKMEKLPPEDVVEVEKGNDLVRKGIEELKKFFPDKAVSEWKRAQAIWEKVATGIDMQDKVTAGGMGGMMFEKDPMQSALGFMKMDIPVPEFDPVESAMDAIEVPDYRRELPKEEAKKMEEEAKKMASAQAQILSAVRKLAREQAGEKEKPDAKEGEPKAEGEKTPNEANDPNQQTAEAPQGEQKPSGETQKGDEQKPSGQQKPSGEQQSGEQKPSGDAQQGQPQGDKKEKAPSHGPADPNQGDKQANADKEKNPSDAKNDPNAANYEMYNPGKLDHAKIDPQDADRTDLSSASRDERKKALLRQQQKLAGDARKLAEDMAKKAPSTDKSAQKVAEHFREAAKEMGSAAQQMDKGELQYAAARGERARKELEDAAKKLQASQFRDLERALDAAETKANLIEDLQSRINKATDKAMNDIEKRTGKPAAESKLEAREKEKLQGLAKMQAENQKHAENLQDYVKDLAKWAEGHNKPDTAEHLKRAQRTGEQDDLAQRMVTAAVNLGQQELEEARDTQDKIDRTLKKMRQSLRSAGDAMAQTKEEKLKRALKNADELAAKAAELAGVKLNEEGKPGETGEKKPGEKKPGEAKPGEKKEGEGKAGEKKDGEGNPETAQGKPGEKKEGEGKTGEKKDGEGNPETAQGKPGEKKEGEGKADAQQAGKPQEGQPGENGEKKPLSDEERRGMRASVVSGTKRLSERLERDQILEPELRAALHTVVERDKSFEERFKEAEEAKMKEYLRALQAVRSRLSEKLESTLKAKRLSNAQREEAPLQYRKMVNSYYEKLSQD